MFPCRLCWRRYAVFCEVDDKIQVLRGLDVNDKVVLLRELFLLWFGEDLSDYLDFQSRQPNEYSDLQKELFDRFHQTLFHEDVSAACSGFVTSLLFRDFSPYAGKKMDATLVYLFFGPRGEVDGKGEFFPGLTLAPPSEQILFSHLEENLGGKEVLRGFADFFELLPAIDEEEIPKFIRWNKRAVFSVLEDLTSEDLLLLVHLFSKPALVDEQLCAPAHHAALPGAGHRRGARGLGTDSRGGRRLLPHPPGELTGSCPIPPALL